jgi:hypothetical protein
MTLILETGLRKPSQIPMAFAKRKGQVPASPKSPSTLLPLRISVSPRLRRPEKLPDHLGPPLHVSISSITLSPTTSPTKHTNLQVLSDEVRDVSLARLRLARRTAQYLQTPLDRTI